MRTRLRRSAKEAIRNKFGDDAIYLALKNPSEHFCCKMARFRLSAEEVFAECLAVLDDIKEDESMASFNTAYLCDNLYNDFRDLSEEGTDENELWLAVNVVTFCVCMCLMTVEKPLFSTLVMRLMGQMGADDACYEELKNTFWPNVHRLGKDKLRDAVEEYMDSDVFLSDEITQMVEKIEREAETASHTPLPAKTTPNVRIAKGKETAVLVVLDCMYKADWFVDSNGNPATNKEKTLKQIMQYAFNKENAHVSQLLSATRDRKLSDNRDYFDELLEQLPKNQ
ncbi:MAG: hypothetical protein K2J84_05345 [Bacteroidaceae bacterium]|nr:hypothetical protein [Bacteroidaceae bacterium]